MWQRNDGTIKTIGLAFGHINDQLFFFFSYKIQKYNCKHIKFKFKYTLNNI